MKYNYLISKISEFFCKLKFTKHVFGTAMMYALLTPAFSQTPCSNYPMIGFAAVSGEGVTTTTGGQGGTVVNITNVDELLAWALTREKNTTPEIVHINGKISTTDATKSLVTIKNGANISILGINGGELIGIGLNIRDYINVIVRNLKIHEVIYPNDGLTIDACHHVWVDHNEFYSINGPNIGVDTYDGLFDIKKSSRYVTASWNVFHDHKKVLLIGHTDTFSSTDDDTKMTITIHHNYFYNNDGRNPSLRFGAVHLFNNYFKIIYDYGIAVRQAAHALIENNVYEQVVTPIATDKFDGPAGFVCERGNIFNNVGPSSITQTDCNWWNSTTLPYSYTLDNASGVAALVIKDAGFCNNNANPTPTLPLVIPGPTGVHDAEGAAGAFSIYPNPSNGESTISFVLTEGSEVELNLYNALGKLVKTIVSGIANAGSNQYLVSTEGLVSGIYVCKLNVNGKTFSQKLIVND